jgi:hypothetical protein
MFEGNFRNGSDSSWIRDGQVPELVIERGEKPTRLTGV